MHMNDKKIQNKRDREKKVVSLMIWIYCHGNHGSAKGVLCQECAALTEYAAARVDHCPHMETKTFCSNCKTHCYKPQMREQIRKVMRYAGPRMILYHPIMAIRHVIEMKKEKKKLNTINKEKIL